MQNSEYLLGITLNDRYEILEKIGTGGMALVYKAHDNVLDRDVAIKALRENFDHESAVVSNFIKEARSSASLVHPNVVSVYDVCEYDGLNYMVMELVNGKTLKEYIKKNQHLPWQESCNYAIQIGQGIQAAHERNIIHRDIKPQNIIMDSSGTLKVTDFGIAKAMESDKAIAGGTAMGSVHYISPEQARGGYTDFRSDIYSLGIVLYEMLAGRVPFDGDNPVSVALMHIEEDPINVKCVNMDVPSDLAYVTMKAINRDPDKRYQNMQDFIDDLRAVLAGETLPSKEIAIPYSEDSDADNKTKKDVNQRELRLREKSRENIMKKKTEQNAVMLAFATALAFVLVILGIILLVANPLSKKVPDFVGLTVEEANFEARKSGYGVELEYEYNDTVEKDVVIRQDPDAGTTLDKHEKITLYVSYGATGGKIEVPNLKNMSIEDAKDIINDLKLMCEVEFVDSESEAGTVIRQSPATGTHMNPAGKVKLYVSTGSDESTDNTKETQKPTDAPGDSDNVSNSDDTKNTPPPTDKSTPTPEPDANATSKRYSVKIPDDARETVHVKIVANGNVLHNSTHSKSEGMVTQEITGSGNVKVQTYIDGVLVNEETLKF